MANEIYAKGDRWCGRCGCVVKKDKLWDEGLRCPNCGSITRGVKRN